MVVLHLVGCFPALSFCSPEAGVDTWLPEESSRRYWIFGRSKEHTGQGDATPLPRLYFIIDQLRNGTCILLLLYFMC